MLSILSRCTQIRVFNAAIWIDPDLPESGWSKVLPAALAWTVLAIPLALFIYSWYLIFQIRDYVPDANAKFPVFAGAPDINKSLFTMLYDLSAISFILSYFAIAYTTVKK